MAAPGYDGKMTGFGIPRLQDALDGVPRDWPFWFEPDTPSD